MKKDQKELYTKLETIVKYIENTLDSALKLECANPLRAEYAITLATRLRVLLNDENKNTSLLSLLKIKKLLLFQANKCDLMYIIPANMVFTSALTSTIITNDTLYCKVNEFTPDENILYTFDAWWNEIIIDSKCEELSQISRRDVILTLADKEGGAHVDDKYDKAYYQALDGGIVCHTSNGEEIRISNNVYAESALYIAQELINAYYIYIRLKPYTYSRANTKYKILQLTYYREIQKKDGITYQKRYRFLRYDYGRLNENIMVLFDYYQLASYRLLDLYSISKSYNTHGVHTAMVVDLQSNSHQIIYARTSNCEIHTILWKHARRYKIIRSEIDFENKKGQNRLENILLTLSPDNNHAFDEYLSKQIIDEPIK